MRPSIVGKWKKGAAAAVAVVNCCDVLLYMGVFAFAVTSLVVCVVSFVYVLPLLLSIFLPFLFLCCLAPVTLYGLILCGAAPCKRERGLKILDAATFVLPHYVTLMVSLFAVHLSGIYYDEYKSPEHFDDIYWRYVREAGGFFVISLPKLAITFRWPGDLPALTQVSLGLSYGALVAGKTSTVAPYFISQAMKWFEAAKAAKTAKEVGLGVAQTVDGIKQKKASDDTGEEKSPSDDTTGKTEVSTDG
uniref:Uncharacterized protein n=1 Tax=Octactis speculum TaxID=3111310 RepID=A0A7S2H7L5_9STRA|mmetsp:Transcript_62121/g.85369  ORF Transcript_62121/g.85369 Transcript_62121/m.85369 type:complete len:247 (+) Transcript_62121:2-742(+)